MKSVVLAWFVLGLVLFTGCSLGPDVKPIQDLRSAGKLTEARELAMTILADSPKAKNIWQEWVRVDLDSFKLERTQKKESDRAMLFEAAFITTAFLQHEGKSPSKVWTTLGLQLFSGLTVECQALIGTMKHQKDLAGYLHDLITTKQDAYGSERSIASTSSSVEDYRDQAATLVAQMATCFALLDVLPENSVGSRSVLKGQIDKDLNDWAFMLELEPSMQETIWDRSQQAVKSFLDAANTDWSDIGYLQTSTVTQMKVK